MGKFFIVVVIVLLAGMFLLLSPKAVNNDLQVWGILRPNGSGTWYLLDDSDHDPSGITSISQTSTYIRVNHTCFSKIHTGYANADETLVINNIDTGFGAGFCYSIIFLAKDGVQINPNTVNYSGSNIWFKLEGKD